MKTLKILNWTAHSILGKTRVKFQELQELHTNQSADVACITETNPKPDKTINFENRVIYHRDCPVEEDCDVAIFVRRKHPLPPSH